MNRKRVLGLAAVGALIFAALATNGFGLADGSDDGPLVLYGNVDIREVDMAFRVGGRITEIAVDEGDKVAQNQLLARLDTASLDSRLGEADAAVMQARAQLARMRNGNRPQDVAQARARVAATKATLREARQDVTRRRPLVEPGAISRDVWQATLAAHGRAKAQFDEAQQAYSLLAEGARAEDVAAANAQLAAVNAMRQSAATDRGDSSLVAAGPGTVVTRAREPGAIVQPGETVLTIAIDRPMRVRAYIGEPDLSRISPGMKLGVSADGNPKTYQGTIGHISPRAEFTPKTVETADLRTDLVYRLRIIVSDPDGALRQGQPVTLTVDAARARTAD